MFSGLIQDHERKLAEAEQAQEGRRRAAREAGAALCNELAGSVNAEVSKVRPPHPPLGSSRPPLPLSSPGGAAPRPLEVPGFADAPRRGGIPPPQAYENQKRSRRRCRSCRPRR